MPSIVSWVLFLVSMILIMLCGSLSAVCFRRVIGRTGLSLPIVLIIMLFS